MDTEETTENRLRRELKVARAQRTAALVLAAVALLIAAVALTF